MDWTLALFGVNVIFGVIAWFMKNTISTIKEIQKTNVSKIEAIQNELTNVRITYVPKHELKELRDEIVTRFDRLEEYLHRNKT